MSTADRPVGRGTCLITALALLLLFSLPLAAFALAIRGEVSWQRGAALDRLFLINEPEALGLGLESVRTISAEHQADCTRTRVHYLLWKGEGENVEYCECSNPEGLLEGGCP